MRSFLQRTFLGVTAFATIAASAVCADGFWRNRYAGYGVPPSRQSVAALAPAARAELFSYGPRVGLTYDARVQIQAQAQSYLPPAQPYRRPVARRSPNPFYPSLQTAQPVKPFANVRPQPTTFDRYWPLLMQPHENPRTGRVILSLP